ncbi:MAG: Hsp20/alpha crystallin family protein [Alphaproteobacteria bacterium]
MSKRHLLPSFWNAPLLKHREGGDPFSVLQREIDSLFNDFARGSRFLPWAGHGEGWAPNVDVTETDHDLQISVELPGVDEKDVEVTVSDNVLTIKGEKQAAKEETEKNYHLIERSYGAFERTIPLPYAIDPDAVDAKFAKGVLTVILPKPPEERKESKKITIKAA